jgi:hypothetical protein
MFSRHELKQWLFVGLLVRHETGGRGIHIYVEGVQTQTDNLSERTESCIAVHAMLNRAERLDNVCSH